MKTCLGTKFEVLPKPQPRKQGLLPTRDSEQPCGLQRLPLRLPPLTCPRALETSPESRHCPNISLFAQLHVPRHVCSVWRAGPLANTHRPPPSVCPTPAGKAPLQTPIHLPKPASTSKWGRMEWKPICWYRAVEQKSQWGKKLDLSVSSGLFLRPTGLEGQTSTQFPPHSAPSQSWLRGWWVGQVPEYRDAWECSGLKRTRKSISRNFSNPPKHLPPHHKPCLEIHTKQT